MQSKAPNEEQNEIRLDDIPQPQLAGHVWRQQGTVLYCESCPFNHAAYIPSDHQLYGVNEKGEPLLRKIEVDVDRRKVS